MLEFVQGNDLMKKGLFGKPDPHLKVSVGNETFISPVVENNYNPEWKYPIEFDVTEKSPKCRSL